MEEESRKGKNGTTLRLILSNENKTRKKETVILFIRLMSKKKRLSKEGQFVLERKRDS